MGEALIDLVRQYPALWDKQHSKYKDSNYKDMRWREISEILNVPKDDAIKKCIDAKASHSAVHTSKTICLAVETPILKL